VAGRKLLLLIDAGGESMHVLASRVRRLGYLVVRAKTTEEAKQLLCDPRYAVSAAVIPPDLPVANLRTALEALRRLPAVEHLAFLVSGRRPSSGRRRELKDAGAEFALWEPVDAHTLRFQINQAMAGHVPRASRRRALRAPASWPVDLRVGRRHKEARVYTISAKGAFLATPAPALPRTIVVAKMALPMATVRATGRVVFTNVPGNLMKRSLPVGMAVRFEGTPPETEALLQMYAEVRHCVLEL
jgi:CheY-like chemotaxis protein